MNFNPLPEEQKDPELVNSLRAIYARKPQDRESLARIEARFSQLSPMETQIPPTPLHNEAPQRFNGPYRPKKGWTFPGTIAALFAVALVTGAILSPFFYMKNQLPVTNQPTPTSQQTPAPTLSKTILGAGTRLAGSFQNAYGFPQNDFHMVNEQVGWATKPDSLFRTADGGNTWKQITLPQELQGSSTLFSVRVFDSDMAFIPLYAAPTGGAARTYFYRTVDAGATWQRFDWPTTPEVAQAGMGEFQYTFLDHERGWVLVKRIVGGGATGQPELYTLFQTNDGGKTWQKISVLSEFTVSNLFFSDIQTGWVTVNIKDTTIDDPNALNPYKMVIYMTRDGGKTWKQQSLPDQLLSSPKSVYLEGIVFMNENEGYLSVSFGIGSGSTYELENYLYRTHDGGETWQMDEVPLPSASPHYQIIDATHLLLQQDLAITDGPRENYALFTLTDGQWVKTSGVIADVKVASVEFIDSQTAVALDITEGSSPDIYRSDDGGKTWQKISTLPDS